VVTEQQGKGSDQAQEGSNSWNYCQGMACSVLSSVTQLCALHNTWGLFFFVFPFSGKTTFLQTKILFSFSLIPSSMTEETVSAVES